MLSNITLGCMVSREPKKETIGEDNKPMLSVPVKFQKVDKDKKISEFELLARVYGDLAISLANSVTVQTPLILTGSLTMEDFPLEGGGVMKVVVLGVTGAIPLASYDGLMGMNSVAVVGRIGNDPDLRYFESGSCVAKTSIAFNQNKNQTSWFDFKTWGKTAETLAEHVRKGHKLGLQGSLDFDEWTDKTTGALVQKPVISAQRIEFLEPKENSGQQAQFGVPASNAAPPQVQPVHNPSQDTQGAFSAAAPAGTTTPANATAPTPGAPW